MHEAPHARLGAGLQRVARSLHVAALEVLAPAPVAERRGRMECQLAALGPIADRGGVLEPALHGLGAARADLVLGCLRAREGAHRVAVPAQSLDQAPADET